MSSDPAVSIFTTDQKAISPDWQQFLAHPEIRCPITPEVSPTAVTYSCTSAQFFGLKFTSTANDSRFKQHGPFIENTQRVVLLGLDSSSSLTPVSIVSVIQAFTGLPGLTAGGGLVQTIISTIPDDAKLNLNAAETRNAVWCVPGQTMTVSAALVFTLPTGSGILGTVKQKIMDELGISIGDLGPLNLYLQRDSYGTLVSDDDGTTPPSFAVYHSCSLTIQTTIDGFDFWFRLDPQGVSVTLTQNPLDETDIWAKLQALGGSNHEAAPPSKSSSMPAGPDILSHVDLLSVSLGKNLGGKFWWRIQTVLEWGAAQHGHPPILIGLSYDSLNKAFLGRLLTKSCFQVDKRLPTYLASADVLPRSYFPNAAALDSLPEAYLLEDIFPEVAGLPNCVPNQISTAQLSYSSQAAHSMLSFAVTVTRSSTAGKEAVPAPFTWDQLSISASKTTTGTGNPKTSTFFFSASSSWTLRPRSADMALFTPASMGLTVAYASGSWAVTGYVQNLSFGVLAGFFDNDAAVDALGKLTIKELEVFYTYSKKSASSFLLSGTITLGLLELRLFYQYMGSTAQKGQTAADIRSKPGDPKAIDIPAQGSTNWQFKAFLGAANGQKATLGDIVDSVVGPSQGSSILPEFVSSIEIAPASGDGSAVSIEVAKAASGVVFNLNILISTVKFSFIQISAGGVTTRVLRLDAGKLPVIGSIPLINQLPQPFDDLVYLWVGGAVGLLDSDVTTINGALDSSERLLYKKITTKPSATAPVIAPGHHFMVINGGQVVLDHVFEIGKDEAKPASQTGEPSLVANVTPKATSIIVARAAAADPVPVPVNSPSKGSLTKTLGPLTFSAITLQYKDKVLWIHMDAVLALGPIALGLVGFGIGFSTTGLNITDLVHIADDVGRLQWELHGLSIAFDKPPLTLAGMFEHDIIQLPNNGSMEVYKGGVGLGFPPYTFVGVGEYSIVQQDGNSYKSLFVFAKLDGPLVTLEFATISGVRLGFGFNSMVRSPSINELADFPFIKTSGAAGAGNNPMAILQSMDPLWVQPKQDSYWLAAGMTITAFDVVAITAVAVFAFRDAGVVISIFADAVAQMPPDVRDTTKMLLYVEMGLVAELNFIDGYFRVEASLAPTSFLLVPECHLTGGFALAYWFGRNPNAGDFVFTLGGYHRAYTPPPFYPVPDRVGISFVIGDNIQMIGQSYFAVTPKVAMAGAMIHISLSVGPVSAYLDAAWDALINFHPLHYVVEFAISVGVECDIDVWFIHIHISAHIGADLHIEGPELGGIATVHFWFFGFAIHFGAPISQPPPLELLDFWKTTHQPGPGTSDRADNDANPVQTLLIYDPHFMLNTSTPTAQPLVAGAAFKFVLEDGNFPQPSKPASATPAGSSPPSVPSTGAGSKWFVRGGSFRFGITTEFGLSSATINSTTVLTSPADVFSRPMHVSQPLTSSLTVTISRRLSSDALQPTASWQSPTLTTKSAPTALWAPYDPTLDIVSLGGRAAPPSDLLTGDAATRPVAMGISLSAPRPILSRSNIPAFNATAAAKQAVTDDAGNDWTMPDLEAVQTRFLGAALTEAEAKMDSPTRWAEVAAGWSAAAVDGEELVGPVLGMATGQVFGWDVAARAAGSKAVWALKGAVPKKLVDGLAEFYLALPRMVS